ncbi:hypothetical protein HMPREF1556_01240 [Porphyromonas sp. oral taxon 278 str. W7784]|nr:hypothetical protein HMPREF1556_01240 [Porphyromonas sp. oral taxon 278 str. W7784]
MEYSLEADRVPKASSLRAPLSPNYQPTSCLSWCGLSRSLALIIGVHRSL